MSELYHHGVKGMKWGVRKDRTTEGKRRSRKSSYKIEVENKNYDDDYYTGTDRIIRISNTKRKSSDRQKALDNFQNIDEYDLSNQLNKPAQDFIRNYKKFGEKKAIKILDSEFADLNYRFSFRITTEKTSISDDVREYLRKNYNIEPEPNGTEVTDYGYVLDVSGDKNGYHSPGQEEYWDEDYFYEIDK